MLFFTPKLFTTENYLERKQLVSENNWCQKTIGVRKQNFGVKFRNLNSRIARL